MYSRRVSVLSVVTAAGLAVSACSPLPETSQPVSASYACGQLDIAVSGREDSDLISVDYLDQRVLLKPQVSASGALYVASGDDQTRFWIKGDKATLTIRGQAYPECLQPVELKTANRNGAEYLATLDDLPITVTVARQRLLRGAVWVVEDIAETGIIDNSRITIEFLEDNRIAGRATCNRYSGTYQLSGEGVDIGPLATTRMACAPALMNQEDRFLTLLGEVTSIRIGQQGQLLLSTPEGNRMRAFQSGHDSP